MVILKLCDLSMHSDDRYRLSEQLEKLAHNCTKDQINSYHPITAIRYILLISYKGTFIF